MERKYISFFGRTNTGKSSLVNALLGQELSVVSDVAGTTTDPVLKTMELLPLGPVVIADTAGTDDTTKLGALRLSKTKKIMERTDIAVLVTEGDRFGEDEIKLAEEFMTKEIPYIVACNKSDERSTVQDIGKRNSFHFATVRTSARTKEGITELKEAIGKIPLEKKERTILNGRVSAGDTVILVCPVDEAAPKGRLILPQQMILRELLDLHALAMVVQPEELDACIKNLKKKPDLVITDSQVFEEVNKILPKEIALTSFSILMADYKGILKTALEGIGAISELKDGDRVLVAEGCTHHRQCGDIGTVKIPLWLEGFSGTKLKIETSSGPSFPESLEGVKLVIHCGGCMLGEKEIMGRMDLAARCGVPFTNYGILIAEVKGILDRTGLKAADRTVRSAT